MNTFDTQVDERIIAQASLNGNSLENTVIALLVN
jgi:hypothetical protein